MKVDVFIRKYSIARLTLAGEAAGVEVHQIATAAHHFGGVIDGDRAWIVGPLTALEASQFIARVAPAVRDVSRVRLAA